MNRAILDTMERKGVTPDELDEALSDLQELEEKHGDALRVAMLFQEDAIENVLDQLHTK